MTSEYLVASAIMLLVALMLGLLKRPINRQLKSGYVEEPRRDLKREAIELESQEIAMLRRRFRTRFL